MGLNLQLLKILSIVYEISVADPGWGKIRIRDREKSGSGIKIPNSQHC